MRYQIADEPQPGGMAHLAVRPVWPLFAIMFGGSWLAFPWFVVNAFAIGCPNRIKTLVLAIVAFLGAGLLTLGILLTANALNWDVYAFRYAYLVLLVWKLGLAYYLMVLQSRTFDLYEHFGGKVANGMLVVVASFFLSRPLLDNLPGWLILVVR